MNDDQEPDCRVAQIAGAIGELARARMLFCLLDGYARTSTELSVVAEISPSTASAHLSRLTAAELVKVSVQGKHRYYSLAGKEVAEALESLSVLAAKDTRKPVVSRVPNRLRSARTCYDHMAGVIGVSVHDRLMELGLLSEGPSPDTYDVTTAGEAAFAAIGIDIESTRQLRRRFACPCLDWSERRPHLAGALGAALLRTALKRKWVVQDLDSRALSLTYRGRKELLSRFGIPLELQDSAA
jgi:DNA-binding transcriptional ArsR family regulator